MDFMTALLLVISLLIGIPFLVYVAVKVGTIAFLQGREQFFSEQKKENRCNGDKKREN